MRACSETLGWAFPSSTSSGLSTGSKLGVGLGIGLGVPLVAAVLIGWVIIHRRRTAEAGGQAAKLEVGA